MLQGFVSDVELLELREESVSEIVTRARVSYIDKEGHVLLESE